MKMRVFGLIKEKESGEPISGLLVCAYDKDVLRSDLLGKAFTGADGKFSIEYESKDFQELLDENPDLYLNIYRGADSKVMDQRRVKPIFSTKKNIRISASSNEKFYIEIPKKNLG